jgi:hypothetical protein
VIFTSAYSEQSEALSAVLVHADTPLPQKISAKGPGSEKFVKCWTAARGKPVSPLA